MLLNFEVSPYFSLFFFFLFHYNIGNSTCGRLSMFCPNCHAYVEENHLLKKNVKKFENVVIEYDARCPACREEIGHMYWGVFTPAQRFRLKEGSLSAPSSPAPPPEASPPFPAENVPVAKEIQLNWPQSSPPEACTCPHCGKLLPKEYKKVGPDSRG
jgi:ssDNA-binding Zn-finger/Zn-ribbon topoisomerase 1